MEMSMRARIKPTLPKGSPERLTFPWMESLGPDARRFFDVAHGFVPVSETQATLLARIHIDGELTERGGKGPIAFDVATIQEAQAIAEVASTPAETMDERTFPSAPQASQQ